MLPLSIIPNSPTSSGAAIAGILSLTIVACVWKARKYPHRLSNSAIILALSLSLIFYLFAMLGADYFSYKEVVENSGYTDISIIPWYYLHYEKPYYVIINIVQNNYLLFRLVVWGSSLLLYWQTGKRLELDRSTFTFYLCICIVQLTAVSRVCLAYAFAFYGFSFIAKPITRKGSNILSFILGIAIFSISLLFHRSSVFLLAVLPLSLFKYNKNTIWLFALAFPFIVIIINTNLFDFILNFNQQDDSLLDAQTALYYLDSDKKRVVGLGQGLEFLMKYGSHVAVVILISKCILNKSYNTWPKHIQLFANVTLFITLIATSLLFSTDSSTYKTFERLIAFSYVPQCCMLAYLLKEGYEKKLVNLISLLLVGYAVYGTIYYNFYLM